MTYLAVFEVPGRMAFLFLFLAISAAGAASCLGTLSAGNGILLSLVLVWDIGLCEIFSIEEVTYGLQKNTDGI